MSTLEALVLPLEQCKELKEKGIFKVGETVYKWQERFECLYDWKNEENGKWFLCESDTIHQLSENDIPAPTLEEMMRKCNESRPVMFGIGRSVMYQIATGVPGNVTMMPSAWSDPKLAAFALLMEAK